MFNMFSGGGFDELLEHSQWFSRFNGLEFNEPPELLGRLSLRCACRALMAVTQCSLACRVVPVVSTPISRIKTVCNLVRVS